VRSLWLECNVRLPGHERTGRPVSNVDDLPFVVTRPPYPRVALPQRGKPPRYWAHRAGPSAAARFQPDPTGLTITGVCEACADRRAAPLTGGLRAL